MIEILQTISKALHSFPQPLKWSWAIWLVATAILVAFSLNYFKTPTVFPKPKPAPQPVKIIFVTIDINGNLLKWEKIKAKGEDKGGKMVSLEIYILEQDFTWKFANDEKVEFNDKESDLKEHLNSKGMQKAMENSQEIVCVGTASQEGESLDKQIDLAEKRAKTLVLWIRKTQPKDGEIYLLNLGQFKGDRTQLINDKNGRTTAHQRRVILISIIERSQGVNLEEALKNALKNKKDLPFNIDDYTSFIFEKKT